MQLPLLSMFNSSLPYPSSEILFFNVCSLRSAHTNLELFIGDKQRKGEGIPLILVCCETTSADQVLRESKNSRCRYHYLNLYGYRSVHRPHPKSTKGVTKGGIVYFIHSSIPSSHYECLPDLGFSSASTSTQTEYLRIDIGGRR